MSTNFLYQIPDSKEIYPVDLQMSIVKLIEISAFCKTTIISAKHRILHILKSKTVFKINHLQAVREIFLLL